MSLVEGYKTPFLKEPLQKAAPKQSRSRDQKILIEMEVKKIVCHQQGEFLSNIFLVGKKGWGKQPVINLNNLSEFVIYQHFIIEGLHCLKFLL